MALGLKPLCPDLFPGPLLKCAATAALGGRAQVFEATKGTCPADGLQRSGRRASHGSKVGAGAPPCECLEEIRQVRVEGARGGPKCPSAETKVRQVVQEDSLPGREGIGSESVDEAQKPLDLLSIHRMKSSEFHVPPSFPIQLVLNQLGYIVGIRELHPAPSGDTTGSPPLVPDPKTNASGN